MASKRRLDGGMYGVATQGEACSYGEDMQELVEDLERRASGNPQ
jgi:hypothetical protein